MRTNVRDANEDSMDKQDREDMRAERWAEERDARDDLRYDLEEAYDDSIDFAEGGAGPKKGRKAPTAEEDDSLDAEIARNFDAYERDVVMARADRDEMNKVRRLGAQIKGMHGIGASQALEAYTSFIQDLHQRPVETLTHLGRTYDPNFRAQVEAAERQSMESTYLQYVEATGISEAVEKEIVRVMKSGAVKIDKSDPIGTLKRAHMAALEGLR
jgi:hypothetical protein